MATLPIPRTVEVQATAEADGPSLAQAFSSFAGAAASLERSYAQLQVEVARLRHELEQSNRDLASSLREKRRIGQHLDRILEALPCGVLVTEADNWVSMANSEIGHLLGVPRDSLLPSALRSLLDQVGPSCSELEYRRAGRETEWITIRRAQLHAEEGGSSIFIVEDISALKRLQTAQEKLRHRQALAEISATLAHEMRNPLGSMELFAGLLAGSGLTPEERGWVEHLQAGLRTLAATVNNVLHLHSQPPPQFAPIDLGELLRRLVQFLRPLAQQAKVRMELCHGLDRVLVAADRHRVEQVILNLARNAFRALPEGGRLKISGAVTGAAGSRQASIEMEDSGPGIAPEILPAIFQPGFTTRPGSPGLGLAVCQTIMEQHHGAIKVESPPGRGATFTLEFPLPESFLPGGNQ